jgi:hypothetical protein
VRDYSWQTRVLSAPNAFTLPKGSSLVSEIHVADIDVEALRERLRKTTDAELQRLGRNSRYMCNRTPTWASRRRRRS